MRFFGGSRAGAGLAVLLALALSACASVSSRYGDRGLDQKGQAYYLPKGVMQVIVTDTGGRFDVTIAGPYLIADPTARLHADLRKGAVSDNDITIKVDPQTQLLTSINVTSTGRMRTIIENLSKGYGYSYDGGGAPVVVFSALYGADQMELAGQEASAALAAYVQRSCASAGVYAANCARYRSLGLDRPGQIVLSTGSGAKATTGNADLGKCRRGLCYRPLVPVKVRSVVAGTYVSEDYFMVPDSSTVSYVSLPSGLFVEQKYKLAFSQGVLVEIDQDTKSEIAGFTMLPTKVLKAIVAAPVDAILGRKSDRGGDDSGDYAASGGSGDSYGTSSADNGVTTTDDCVMDKGMCQGIGFRSVTIPLDGSGTASVSQSYDYVPQEYVPEATVDPYPNRGTPVRRVIYPTPAPTPPPAPPPPTPSPTPQPAGK